MPPLWELFEQQSVALSPQLPGEVTPTRAHHFAPVGDQQLGSDEDAQSVFAVGDDSVVGVLVFGSGSSAGELDEQLLAQTIAEVVVRSLAR
jgi:hypothetical protein